jgi:N-acetylmuramoyl-L-alanine amidase CwlA
MPLRREWFDMPRIGGPGGPHVPPQTQAPQAAETPKTDFASKVTQAAATQGTEAARTQTAKAQQQSQLVGKARDIARRFAKGSLDQKEATREFVELVIEERLPQFKKRKKKKDKKDDDEPETEEEQLEAAVTELIDRDPALKKRLQMQFKKLASQKG